MTIFSHESPRSVACSILPDPVAEDAPRNPDSNSSQDGLLYSGNRHENVPRALFLDKCLTPLERNAWQVFRLYLNQDGITAFPTYDQLSRYLASMPCSSKASHETVARALTILRLARWLSLVRRQRDLRTGRIKSNLYVLHDEPLSPYEAMQLDPDYFEMVSRALNHASKAIQRVGSQVLQDIVEDPMLAGQALPTRLDILAQRMGQQIPDKEASYPQGEAVHESEEALNTLLRNREWRSSVSEVGDHPCKINGLRNPKQDRTSVLSKRNNSVRTVPRTRELQHLRLPERFLALNNEQQAGALAALQQVNTDQQQSVLDEWTVRCCDSRIRNPAGYLFGIIQKAIRGEFKAWAWPGDATNKNPATLSEAALQPLSHPESDITNQDAVEARLERLYSLLYKK